MEPTAPLSPEQHCTSKLEIDTAADVPVASTNEAHNQELICHPVKMDTIAYPMRVFMSRVCSIIFTPQLRKSCAVESKPRSALSLFLDRAGAPNPESVPKSAEGAEQQSPE